MAAPSAALPATAYNDLPDEEGTWVVRDLLPIGGSMNLYGAPKAGKSHWVLQMAHAIAAGEPDFLGFPVESHGPVLYVQLDTPRSLWKQRTRDYQALGLDQTNLYIADRQIAPFPFEILRADMGADWLRQQCDQIQPLVVIIDVLRNMTMVDEDKSGPMMQALNALRVAIDPAAVILMSHAKKANLALPIEDRDNVIQDNRGSSFIPGAVDGIVKLTGKQMICQSRTMEEKRIGIRFTPQTLWTLNTRTEIEFEAMLEQVLGDPSLSSERAKARQLAELTGRSPDAARRALQRAREAA